jgi:hypothetical protein
MKTAGNEHQKHQEHGSGETTWLVQLDCNDQPVLLQLSGQNFSWRFFEDLDGILPFQASFTLLAHHQDTW